MGATPLSTPTTMRGKSVEGKTAIGIVNARYAPAATSVRITNTIDLPWRALQCSVCGSVPEGGGAIVICSLILLLVLVLLVLVLVAAGAFRFRFAGVDAHLGAVLQSEAADRDYLLAHFDAR